MSQMHTMILGLLAGGTIVLGLPLGRLRRPMPGVRQFLNAVAIGILVFLLWDVLAAAWEPIDAALGDLHGHTGGLWPVIGYGTLFFLGLGIGLMSLSYYERMLTPRPVKAHGPGAMAVDAGRTRWVPAANLSPAARTALLIAVGIGLHNFGEGLAIGGSAAQGEISLATLLVIGFALHNATEGFGIVAPLAAAGERPSWRFLITMGAIGGAPTFVGTIIGRQFTNDVLSIAFLTVAAGSILYVVMQLVGVAHRAARRELLMWGILVGLFAGFVTDMVVTAGGV